MIDQDFIDFFADDVMQKMAISGKKEDIDKIIDKMPSVPIPNKAFRNRGDLTFEDMGEKWGVDLPTFSNGAAYGDLDNDGDLDLVVNNVNMEALVYRNNTGTQHPENHYLTVLLKGAGLNTYAIGSKIYLYRQGKVQSAEVIPSRGFQSSVDYKTVFGLGASTGIDSLVVIWYDYKKTVLVNPSADQLLTIDYTTATEKALPPKAPAATLFETTPSPFAAHREDVFVDFYQEGLSFKMLSREGPNAAVADVNGDGTEDVFIGGASGQSGQLYLQTAAGFKPSDQAAFDPDSTYEDTAVLFFDADGDKDPDLFVGSGGNAQPTGSRFMQCRLYINDGKGHFTVNPTAFTLNGHNTAVAVPLDIMITYRRFLSRI